jgi:2-dehydropantoate 2-reductase
VRLVVVGAGAIGSLFAARLASHGEHPLLVGRPPEVDAIRARGLEVVDGASARFPVDARTHLPPRTPADLVVLAVKSFDARQAAMEVAQAVAPPTVVLALQNGLGVDEWVREGLTAGGWPADRGEVVQGVNSVPATLLRPGVVRAAGSGELVLPEPGEGLRLDALRAFAKHLEGPTVTVRWTDHIQREVWRKLLVNAAINPVTADHRVVNGALLREPLRAQAEQLLREAQRAAALAGYPFTDDEADRELWKVVRATAENRSSMLQDLDRGRPTEVEAISGAVLAEGRRHGVELPATERALRRIRERAARGGSAGSGQSV